MPWFGNKTTFLASRAGIDDDLYGHFDWAAMAIWGMPVPACIVKKVWVYADGSPVVETAVLRFGIYNASAGPPYTNWPLRATTPTISIGTGAPLQWWSVDVNIPLPAGFYALSVLDINGPAMTWSAGLHWVTKLVGMCVKSFTGGVFPDPLGICVTTNQDPCLYADYVLAGAYTPTAAHFCQPKCGG